MIVTREKFQVVYSEYRNTVYSVILTRVRNVDDAQDLCQETFIKLLKCGVDFSNGDHLKAWLLRVAINLSLNHIRDNSHMSAEEISEEIPYYDRIVDNELLTVVAQLPEEYRTVIHLYYYDDYSTARIAEILDLKESTVRVRLKRGREKLRRMLNKDDWFTNSEIL